MRRVLLAPIIALLVLPVLGALAAGAAEPLAADIQHGMVLVDNAVTLYKKNGVPGNYVTEAYLGSDDLRRIMAWPGDTVYVVVYVRSVDPYVSMPPRINARIYIGLPSSGNLLYESDYISVPGPGVYEIPLAKSVFSSKAVQQYGARLVIHIWDVWNVNTANGAPDSAYSVVITRIMLAPPQGAINDKPQGQVVETSGRLSNDARLAIAAGAGFALALLVFIAARRRW